MDFLSELSLGAKVAIGAVLLAIVAIGAGVIWYQHREVGTLNQQNGAEDRKSVV